MHDRRTAVLEAFTRHRCSAILRTPHRVAVRPALDAAVRGGFRIVEVTMNTPDCLAHVEALAKNKELTVGVGTVLTMEDAKRAMAAGAQFLVSPVTDPQIITFCRQHELIAIPGAATPTEMMTAHIAGADVVKLFPGPASGPDYLRAVRGPLPFLKVFPTSGVTEENCQDWLAAGAFGVGFVGSLFAPDELAAGDFDSIEARARRCVHAVNDHATQQPPKLDIGDEIQTGRRGDGEQAATY